MFLNPSPDRIRDLLTASKTIAVVGYSPRPERPSHSVARAMQRAGYRIIPVRPGITEGLGERACASLSELNEIPDVVDVFRAPRYVDGIVDECLQIGARTLWLQEGVVDEAAAQRAQDGGMTVIMDRCILKEYWKLVR